jgi:capsule biosynthesis phosphatase
MKKIICFDLDNTLCSTKKNYYKNSRPIKKNIKFVNFLKGKGFYIKIFTSRFMGRTNENSRLASQLAKSLTKKQLLKWNVKYDELIFGKPSYDFFIDDKSLNYKKNWIKDLRLKLKINSIK